ncbi:MAG TPA: RNase H family protein [Acidimicrobiales bacterium]
MTTLVYTDGACLGNPGPGGWAWAVPDGPFASGAEARTTNQRMEITAALEALRALEGPVTVVSDSTYVVNCWRDRWWEGWLAKGWVNSAKKPVANRDLWEPMVEQFRHRQGLRFQWVKGHSGDAMNDVVDRLAVEAATTQQGRSGDRPPEELGPADAVVPAGGGGGGGGATRRDPRLPAGRLVVVAGHRPPELGGYDENPVAGKVRRRLAEILEAKRELHPDVHVLTGLGLGAEQLGAEAAAEAGVPYTAVLAFPAFHAPWPAASKERFLGLLRRAAGEVVLQKEVPDSKQKAGGALRRRDEFLARAADEAVVVWDGDDEAVGRLVRTFHDRLGEEEVWVVEP